MIAKVEGKKRDWVKRHKEAAMEMTTQQKGKLAELMVFGELIRRGADLYLPVVDIGIDAILRQKNGKYVEIQVKSTKAKDQAGYFNASFEPRGNLFIVCVEMSREDEGEQPEVWIIPSTEFEKYAYKTKEGYRLPLYDKSIEYENRKRSKILGQYYASKHEDAWKLLTGSS